MDLSSMTVRRSTIAGEVREGRGAALAALTTPHGLARRWVLNRNDPWYRLRRSVIVVAEVDGQPLAWAGLAQRAINNQWLASWFVREDVRGHGIAARLTQALVEAERLPRRVYLMPEPHLVRLMERGGYRCTCQGRREDSRFSVVYAEVER